MANAKFICATLSIPDCDLFAGADESKAIYIWKKGKESPIVNLSGNSSYATSLILNSSQAELYTGLKGGGIIIFDLESSKVKFNLQGHSSMITAMCLAKVKETPAVLVSGSLDGKVKIWDLRSKNNINIKGHLDGIKALSVSPDCSLVASGAEDGVVRLWDIRANKILKEFSIEDQNTINCVEFNPHSITLAYGANDRTLKHWDLERFTLISVTPVDRLPIQKLKFDSTGKNTFVATNETLKYWMIDDYEPKLIDMYDAAWNKLSSFEFVENEGIYALGISNSKINLWMHPIGDGAKDIKKEIRKEIVTNRAESNPKKFEQKKNFQHKNTQDFFTTENVFNLNQNDNVFLKNGKYSYK